MLLPRGSRESRHSPPGERRVPERSTCGRIDTSFLSTRLKRAPARAAIEASEAVLARRPAIVGKLLNLLPDGLVPEGLPGGLWSRRQAPRCCCPPDERLPAPRNHRSRTFTTSL